MFYLIGLGLGDPTDISIQGQQIIQRCDRVYLEAYTSVLLHGAKDALEAFHGCNIVMADREQVEQGAGELLAGAATCDVALLVVGDPLGATTHTDLILRAKSSNIPITVISNASVLTAVGLTGLDLAKFGEVVSIPFWDDFWKPESFYDKIIANLKLGLHTLCLLDIKVKEQSVENLVKNRKVFEPPRFMRTDQAASQLLQIFHNRQQQGEMTGQAEALLLAPDTTCVACVRLGTPEQLNLVASLREMSKQDLGAPLHSLVVCAPLTVTEETNARALGSYFTGERQATPADSTNSLKSTEAIASGSVSGRLYLVGLGLTVNDITIKGLKAMKQCSVTILDERTRHILLAVQQEEDLYSGFCERFNAGDKECLRDALCLTTAGFNPHNPEELLSKLKSGIDVALVSWGDPLVFTDYCSLLTKIISENLQFEVIHNASLLNSIASCGLQLYTFGETVQLPASSAALDDQACHAIVADVGSFYNKILQNHKNGWHTLCLLHGFSARVNCNAPVTSINPLTPNAAAAVLMRLVALHSDGHSVLDSGALLTPSTQAVGVAGLGGVERQFKTCSLELMAQQQFTAGPVYAIIIAGHTHPLEDDCLALLTERISIS